MDCRVKPGNDDSRMPTPDCAAPYPRYSSPMDASDRTNAMAQWMWDARTRRLAYRNLPAELKPASLREAYAAQEAYYRLAEPVYGAVCGAKIATTTKVMRELMGIDHPCGGAIFSQTIHYSPAHLHLENFINVRIESEIALMLGADLPASGAPWRRDKVAPAISAAMPAFELIEDRNADYTTTDAASSTRCFRSRDWARSRWLRCSENVRWAKRSVPTRSCGLIPQFPLPREGQRLLFNRRRVCATDCNCKHFSASERSSGTSGRWACRLDRMSESRRPYCLRRVRIDRGPDSSAVPR
jgi:hypothetical protein